MGKSSAPAAPNYAPVAQSSLEAAQLQQQTSKDQLDWAKTQYADAAPATKAYLKQMTDSTAAQTANAATDRARYETKYQPIEDQFNTTATGWNSSARAEQQAGAAQADVASQFDAARHTSQASLESFGIDPSQTRYGALDLGTRVAQAAATAAAGTQSRQNTQATGLALEGEAINIGKGYPGQVAQSYAGATNAGASGINASNNTASTYGSLMGTASQWAGTANQSLNTSAGALNSGYQNQLSGAQFEAQQGQAASSGIGSLVGGLAMAAIM